MTLALSELESLSLSVSQEIRVNASLEITFEALLEQLGPSNEMHNGTPLPLTIEPWPGGRWFRDLGNNDGHYWATVQSIKRPTLLEFTGPLFMSYPVINQVQYRLSHEDGVTLIKFRHAGFGHISEDHRRGVSTGWTHIHEAIRLRAERQQATGR